MEDEVIIRFMLEKTAKPLKPTAKTLLAALKWGLSKAYSKYKDNKNKNSGGEVNWDKIMNSSDPVTVKEFNEKEIDLQKFKEELSKYKIDFSFEKKGENILIAYKVKHKDIVEKSLNDLLEKMVKNPNFLKNIKKDLTKQTLDEKISNYKDITDISKSLSKAQGIGSVGKILTKIPNEISKSL